MVRREARLPPLVRGARDHLGSQVGKDIGATFDYADIESLLDTCPAFHETPGGVKPATKAQMFTIAADAPVSLFHEGSYDDAKFQKVKK